jgi:SMODS and SLOG-associating 2TM effector domain
MTGYALNAAIGLQVLLGSLTTAIAAATSGKSVSQDSFLLRLQLLT